MGGDKEKIESEKVETTGDKGKVESEKVETTGEKEKVLLKYNCIIICAYCK